MTLSSESRRRVIDATRWIIANFGESDWLELGLLTGQLDLIQGHSRLLRSLSFSNEDYRGHAIQVLDAIASSDRANISIIEDYIASRAGVIGTSVSSTDDPSNRIVFSPTVFHKPQDHVDHGLVSVMMPFQGPFEPVFEAISSAASELHLRCLRASDIWENSPVIQDIFSLIYRSFIVVCDFSGKNANVFYEPGIAHTLGKHVVPITQSVDDVPFDLRHHRFVHYLNNSEGRLELKSRLVNRFDHLLSSRR